MHKAFYTPHRFYLICSFASHVHLSSCIQLFIMQKLKQRPNFYSGQPEFFLLSFFLQTLTHTNHHHNKTHLCLYNINIMSCLYHALISVTKTESKPHSHTRFPLVTKGGDINVTWIANAWGWRGGFQDESIREEQTFLYSQGSSSWSNNQRYVAFTKNPQI